MAETFQVEGLPYIDQKALKCGRCPWCAAKVYPVDDHDECSECGDVFEGALTIED